MPGYRIEAPFFEDQEAFDAHVERMKNNPGPSPSAWAIFGALQSQSHIYAGTVPPEVIAVRRRRNKQARKSRRINRQAAKR